MTAIYISFDKLICKNYNENKVIYVCVMVNKRQCFSTTKKKCKKQILNFFGQKINLPLETKRLDFSIIQVQNQKFYRQLAKFQIKSKEIEESLNRKKLFELSDQNYKLCGHIKRYKNISQITIEETENQFEIQQGEEYMKNNIFCNPQANFGRLLTPKGSTSNIKFFKDESDYDIDAKSDISPQKSSKFIFNEETQNHYQKKKTSSTCVEWNHDSNIDQIFQLNKQNEYKGQNSPKKKQKSIQKEIQNSFKTRHYRKKFLIGGIIGLFSGLIAATHSF